MREDNKHTAAAEIDLSRDFVILMTASVRPNSALSDVVRVDPNAREKDYIQALIYYLSRHPSITRFVFADNSGWDLSRIEQSVKPLLRGQTIEFLSTGGNDYPGEFSIGYGESVLIERAFASSSLLRTTRYFVKVTGRLRLQNISGLLRTVRPSDDFYGDWKNYRTPVGIDKSQRGFRAVRLGWFKCEMLDTRFLVLSPSFYKQHLASLHHHHHEGRYWLEGAWLDVVRCLAADPHVTTRLRAEPRWAGVSGTFGWNYGGPLDRCKTMCRAACRSLAPWYHI